MDVVIGFHKHMSWISVQKAFKEKCLRPSSLVCLDENTSVFKQTEPLFIMLHVKVNKKPCINVEPDCSQFSQLCFSESGCENNNINTKYELACGSSSCTERNYLINSMNEWLHVRSEIDLANLGDSRTN